MPITGDLTGASSMQSDRKCCQVSSLGVTSGEDNSFKTEMLSPTDVESTVCAQLLELLPNQILFKLIRYAFLRSPTGDRISCSHANYTLI